MKAASIFLVFLISLLACTQNKEKQADSRSNGYETEYQYAFNPDSTTLTWIAYKYTDRAGVSGTFDSLSVIGTKLGSGNPIKSIRGAEFKMTTESINTGIKQRDNTIFNNFFSLVLGNKVIGGRLMSFNDDGSGTIALSMNQQTHEVPVTWKRPSHNIIEVTGSIDLFKWNLNDAHENLNQICYDLHTGSDGVSKLWPDVSFNIRSVFAFNE